MNCSFNNIARRIGLLDKMAFLFVQVNIQVRAFEIGIPLRIKVMTIFKDRNKNTKRDMERIVTATIYRTI